MTTHAEKWAICGRQASVLGQHAFGLRALEHAVAGGVNDAATWTALGIARAHARQTEGAIAALQNALTTAPDAIDVWAMIAELALELQQLSLALQALTKCHALDPTGATSHGARAKALTRKTYKRLAAVG